MEGSIYDEPNNLAKRLYSSPINLFAPDKRKFKHYRNEMRKFSHLS